jgi:hypothetical protein
MNAVHIGSTHDQRNKHFDISYSTSTEKSTHRTETHISSYKRKLTNLRTNLKHSYPKNRSVRSGARTRTLPQFPSNHVLKDFFISSLFIVPGNGKNDKSSHSLVVQTSAVDTGGRRKPNELECFLGGSHMGVVEHGVP